MTLPPAEAMRPEPPESGHLPGKTVVATVEAQLSGFLDARALAEAEAGVRAAEATKMQRRLVSKSSG
jgi:hypothetical protein